MIALRNDRLKVDILDPIDDRDRFGIRYCTGGYIFQVSDPARGPLMSGPTYPDDFNWFDGQGLPDAFNRAPLVDPADPTRATIVGIGLCDLEAKSVIEFCDWSVKTDDSRAVFETSQSQDDQALTLTRTVTLFERTIRSHTAFTNTGKGHLSVCWFPHPFYPHPTETDDLCRISVPVSFPENDGFVRTDTGFIARKGWPWTRGHFQALDHEATAPATILQTHPVLGLVSAVCSYVPAFFPIWGNTRTFSFEPYLERTVASGQTLTWWIDYHW